MKRIIIILILFQFCNSSLIAQSIKLSGYISPRAGANNPSHIDSLGKGGFMVVSSKLDRDSIPLDRRKFGMLVFVQNNNTLYQLKDSASAKLYSDSTDWLSIGLNSSVDVDKFLKYAKTSDSLYIKGNTLIGNTLKLDSTSSGADSLQYAKNKKIDSANSVRLVIGGGLRVDSSVYFNKDLEVKGNLILNTGLKFNDSLIVTKGARIDSSLILKGKLLLGDSLVASGNGLIKGKVQLDSTLYVNRVATLNDSLNVKGNVQLDSTLFVNRVATLNDSLNVKGRVQLDSTLFVNRVTTLNDSLNVKGNVQLDSTLFVNRVTTLNDSLNVKGKVQLDSILIINDSLRVKGNVLIDTNLTVDGNVTIGGKLTVTSGLEFKDSLLVSRGARIDSSLLVKGNLLLGDSLIAKGKALIGSIKLLDTTSTAADSVQYEKNRVIDSANSVRLVVGGGVRIDSSVYIKGSTLIGSTLKLDSTSSGADSVQYEKNRVIDSANSVKLVVGGGLRVDSSVYVNKDLEINGNLILNTGLKFNDSLIVTKGARIDSSLILKGKLYLGDSLIAKEKALIGSTLTLDSTSTTADSIVYNSNKLIDSANSVKLVVGGGIRVDSSVYIRGNFRLGGDLILDSGLFRSNFVVNLGEGVKFGRYNYKDTIQAKGKTIDQVFYEILTDITHPVYILPTLKILYLPEIDVNSTSKILEYEIGKDLGTINLSSNFVQNDAGSVNSIVYMKNGTIITDSSDIVSALDTTILYTSTYAYDSGMTKVNRIGSLDSTGKILAGTITSDTITIKPIAKNYWGYSLYADSTNISDSLMLGIDSTSGKGFSDFANSASKTSFTIPITGGENYIYYAYPAFYPDLTSIMVGPFESIDAFTKIIRNVKNAQNYTQAYKIYVSINNFSDKVEKIVIN